ncbi:cysteine desulfurase NifS [Bacillus sp. M6-12]|uniref:cysteine desulfurase family protein n=1 Tax=Bacillus sp. M6-12 TaxID=2054166 RepID=UPI000C78EE7E|nr:cysteine desulfurase family protein [Bacillus sp. M6-12]PLS14855.1 cysteine desulfurase NifS [Bacillus sp. M6-12]
MIYFDNSATTKPFQEVIESFVKVSNEFFGNPSSLHGMGANAEKLLSQARKQIAGILQVKESEVFFTSGGTEGNNIAIKGAALSRSGRGKHIITTEIEHASVRAACEQLEAEFGFEITYLKPGREGKVSLTDLKQAVREDTILVSIMHVNNEVGSIQPIEEIGAILKEYPNALFHVDHVQGAGKIPLHFKNTDIDLCTLSAHKFHGLKGTGVLFIKEGLRLFPLFSGGSQESGIRSGTENVAGAVSVAKALRLVNENRESSRQIKEVNTYLRECLAQINGIEINSPEDAVSHILNFSLPGIKSEVFVHALEERNIFVSTTSACSSRKKSVSKTVYSMFASEERAESTVRISLSFQNTMQEAQAVVQAITETVSKLKSIMR